MKINTTPGRTLTGRLQKGEDLLRGLEKVCREEKFRLGELRALGAVARARLGYYDQGRREYRFIAFDEPLEIVSLVANVSIKDGEPFVHAHVTLADSRGAAFGGHLAEGTEVFACEYTITEQLFDGAIERSFDEATGLYLWS